MASFSSLPPETILNILDYVEPGDLDSFSLISKDVHALAQGHRAEHRFYQSVLPSTLTFYGAYMNDKHELWAVDLLHAVLEDYRVAHYIRHLRIEGVGPLHFDPWTLPAMGQPPQDDRKVALVKEAIEQYAEGAQQQRLLEVVKFEEDGINDVLINKIPMGDNNRFDGPILFLLLLLLPNLTSLRIELAADEHFSCERYFPWHKGHSQLQDVTLKRHNALHEWDWGLDIGLLATFMALPSLRTFRGICMPLGDDPTAFREICRSLPECNLSTLILKDCEVGSATLRVIFEECPHLVNFRSTACFIDQCKTQKWPGLVTDCFPDHTKRNLQKLTWTNIKAEGFVENFHEFAQLKSLQVNIEMLVGRRAFLYSSASRGSRSDGDSMEQPPQKKQKTSHHVEFTSSHNFALHGLAALLPPSVETLVLQDCGWEQNGAYGSIALEIAGLKRQGTLPNLHTLCFESSYWCYGDRVLKQYAVRQRLDQGDRGNVFEVCKVVGIDLFVDYNERDELQGVENDRCSCSSNSRYEGVDMEELEEWVDDGSGDENREGHYDEDQEGHSDEDDGMGDVQTATG